MAIPKIAEASQAELLKAAMQNGSLVKVDVATTTSSTVAAGIAGYSAAIIAGKVRSSGAANAVQFTYGSSPTDLTGDFEANDGADFEVKLGEQIIAAPEGEDLKMTLTIGAGGLDGFLQVAYIKIRS